MNWNEWRGFCSENGLSQEEASESWGIYKEIISEAAGAAIYSFLEEDDHGDSEAGLDAHHELRDENGRPPPVQSDDPAYEKHLMNEPSFHPYLNDLLNLQEKLHKSLSEEPDDQLDDDLIAVALQDFDNLSESIHGIRKRIQHHRECANTLEKEAESIIRRSLE